MYRKIMTNLIRWKEDKNRKPLILRGARQVGKTYVIKQLAFIYGKAILPEKTLIVFDEIQECPDALNSLKYFEEEAKEYHIISAGSLLGIRLSHTSFPVKNLH